MNNRLYRFFTYCLAAFAALAIGLQASAQNVHWRASAKQMSDSLYEVTVTASVARGMHIYDLGPYTSGPNATVVEFSLPEGVSLEGALTPSREAEKEYVKSFKTDIGTYEGVVSFTQMVKCTTPGAELGIHTEWQACTGTNCQSPEDYDTKVVLGAAKPAETSVPASDAGIPSLWGMILTAILWGFAALLTPCVFPVVPMTVSFFMKGEYSAAQNRFRALMYGVFIVLLYTLPIALLILITRLIGGDAVTADIFNWLATHWLPNILFFIVFMVFAASFFGAFEIVLPSKLQNGSDAQVDKRKGLGGVFFLALTLVLVSFSCTGPIVGTVLINATSGQFWAPIVTMLAFSLAFALPFVFCAMFPGLLRKLPKSGGWLNTVKVVLGFIEVALGFKFLSTADQVYHWGILDREVYLAIWIAVFTLLGFYLLGKIRFKYDSELKHISVGRLALAIADFAFVIYMLPGMLGAPLKAISGYLPPLETQDFVLAKYSPAEAATPQFVAGTVAPGQGKFSDKLKLPLGLKGYFDLSEAKAYAVATGQPIFLDFTGHGCVNCREMEARVWSDQHVLELLGNRFVVCALYTDDKMELPQSEWVTTDSGKVLKTLGKVNSHYALKEFGVAAQPYYVVMTAEGKVLGTRSYNLDAEAFSTWLESFCSK